MIKENMKGVKQLKKKDNQRIITLVDRAKQKDPRLARAIQAAKDEKQAIKDVSFILQVNCYCRCQREREHVLIDCPLVFPYCSCLFLSVMLDILI